MICLTSKTILIPYTTLFRSGMVDAGFENQKELTKMQLDNQKEIAEMQNETQKEIAGIQSATSRQNTKDQVYAQNEMLRSEERFSRNAETELVCRLLLEKKKKNLKTIKTQQLILVNNL